MREYGGAGNRAGNSGYGGPNGIILIIFWFHLFFFFLVLLTFEKYILVLRVSPWSITLPDFSTVSAM